MRTRRRPRCVGGPRSWMGTGRTSTTRSRSMSRPWMECHNPLDPACQHINRAIDHTTATQVSAGEQALLRPELLSATGGFTAARRRRLITALAATGPLGPVNRLDPAHYLSTTSGLDPARYFCPARGFGPHTLGRTWARLNTADGRCRDADEGERAKRTKQLDESAGHHDFALWVVVSRNSWNERSGSARIYRRARPLGPKQSESNAAATQTAHVPEAAMSPKR